MPSLLETIPKMADAYKATISIVKSTQANATAALLHKNYTA